MKTITKLAATSLFALVLAAAGACGEKKPPNPPVTDTSDSGASSEEGGAGEGGAAANGEGGAATAEAPKKDCHKDMWEKYKAEGFGKVVDLIVAKSIAAPEDKIGKSFKKTAKDKKAQAKLKTNLLAFLQKVYGGDDKAYKGKEMPAAHKGMKITSEQYDYFITEIVVPSLKEAGVEESDVTNCFAPPVTDEAFKGSIVGK